MTISKLYNLIEQLRGHLMVPGMYNSVFDRYILF